MRYLEYCSLGRGGNLKVSATDFDRSPPLVSEAPSDTVEVTDEGISFEPYGRDQQ